MSTVRVSFTIKGDKMEHSMTYSLPGEVEKITAVVLSEAEILGTASTRQLLQELSLREVNRKL